MGMGGAAGSENAPKEFSTSQNNRAQNILSHQIFEMCVVSIHPLYQNHHQQDGTKHTTIQKLII
jgi:hypothetical protein